MHLSLNTNNYIIPCMGMGKKTDHVDKGTTRKTPGNNEGARPPKKEDYDKIQDENDEKEKKDTKKESSS